MENEKKRLTCDNDSEAARRAKSKYLSKRKTVTIVFFPKDEDVEQWLEGKSSKATYIKDLLRREMEKEQMQKTE